MYYKITRADDIAKLNVFLKQEQIQIEQWERAEELYLRELCQKLIMELKNDPGDTFDYRVKDEVLLPALMEELKYYITRNDDSMILDAVEVYADLYMNLPERLEEHE